MEKPLFDDQAAGNDLFADVVTETVDWTISIPSNVREKFERMAADGIAEEFLLGTEALKAIGFNQRDGREAIEIAGREKPGLVIFDFSFLICDCLLLLAVDISFEFPILSGAGLAEGVEGADTNKGCHFFWEGLDAAEEVSEGGKLGEGTFAQNGFFGAVGEAFDLEGGDADGKAEGRRPKSERRPKFETRRSPFRECRMLKLEF